MNIISFEQNDNFFYKKKKKQRQRFSVLASKHRIYVRLYKYRSDLYTFILYRTGKVIFNCLLSIPDFMKKNHNIIFSYEENKIKTTSQKRMYFPKTHFTTARAFPLPVKINT